MIKTPVMKELITTWIAQKTRKWEISVEKKEI